MSAVLDFCSLLGVLERRLVFRLFRIARNWRGHSSPQEDLHLLDIASVQRIYDAVLALDLERTSLIASLPAEVRGGLPLLQKPAEQIWSDANILNQMGTLSDGCVPLQLWLEAAVVLGGRRREVNVLRAILGEIPSS